MIINAVPFRADVAELVDALVLGTSVLRRGGSIPSIRTKFHEQKIEVFCIIFVRPYMP